MLPLYTNKVFKVERLWVSGVERFMFAFVGHDKIDENGLKWSGQYQMRLDLNEKL